MAKKKVEQGYPLPDNDGPWEYIPVCIPIPDDPQHRRNFLGAILMLTRWFSYEKTGDNRGKIAASAWDFSLEKVIETVNGVNPCCGDSGVIYRMNGDKLEQSTDGGESWYSVPDGDTYWPPDDAPLLPPLPGSNGDAKACQAAWNATRVYQAFHVQLSPYFVLGGIAALAISAVVTGFVFLLGGGPLGYAAVSGVVTAALSLVGADLVADDFDEETAETLMCILVDHFGSDGTMNDGEFTAALADISAEAGLIWDAIYLYVEGMGIAGMNNAARSQSVTDPECNCDENWCYTFDFTASNGGWTNLVLTNGDTAAWVTGFGWHSAVRGSPYDGLAIKVAFPAGAFGQVTKVTLQLQSTISGANPQFAVGTGTTFSLATYPAGVFPNPASLEAVTSWNINNLTVLVNRAGGATYQPFNNNYIQRITIEGVGVNPFGADNC